MFIKNLTLHRWHLFLNLHANAFVYFFDIHCIYNAKVMQNSMNILNFLQQFPDKAYCIAYLNEQREQLGVVCKRCG